MSKESNKLLVRGILKQVVGIGGESTGWAIDLDESLQVSDKRVAQIEINHEPSRWERFENNHVQAEGERRSWPVLDVESIRAI
jgi:hypothetical protein